MSDAEQKDTPMAECGSCRAIIPLDSKKCPECGIGFSGVSEEALGECGACNSLVPINSKSCPDCGVFFVADDVLNVLKEWFEHTGVDSRKLFAKFDADSDGKIDADELKDGLLKMKLADLPPSQIDRLIAEVDTDQDGVISLDELVAAITGEPVEQDVVKESVSTAKQYSENVVERVTKKFEIVDKEQFLVFAADFDENQNDYLTEAELKKAAQAYVDHNSEIVTESTEEEVEVSSKETTDEANDPDDDESAETVQSEDENRDDKDDESSKMDDNTEIQEVIESDILIEDKEDESNESTSEDYLRQLVIAASEQDMTIRSIFETVDLDENGLIDGPELQKGISAIAGDYLSPGEIMGIISMVDNDSDGRINAYELIDIIDAMDIDIESDRQTNPIDLMINYMEVLDIDAGALFRNLDTNRDGFVNRDELSEALNAHANEEIGETAIADLIKMFDVDGNDSIDLFEFIQTLESHEDEVDEETALSAPKEFPSKWQKRMMSKKWKDVVWPIIHTGFAFFILLWVVNGTLAPFVDGSGGTVVLDTEFGQATGEDGTVYFNGDSYPCDDDIQIGGCKNSLSPLAGEAGAISMPAGFYWDGILFIALGVLGLVGGLVTQLALVPGWRARVVAMRENEAEKEAVKETVSDDTENDQDAADTEDDDVDREATSEEVDAALEEEFEDDDEIDIGSFIGLVLEDEEVFGTIIEFDDDEGLVTIEEDGTGDLVTGYQDDMFLED